MLPEFADRPRLGNPERVVRYVGGQHFDPATGRINGSAFDRSHKDVDGVSVTRRSVLADDDCADRNAIRTVVGSRLKFGKTAVFAELPVDDALAALVKFAQEVFFCEDPLPEEASALANPAHALLVGFPFKGEAIGSLTSEIAGDQLRLAISGCFAAIG